MKGLENTPGWDGDLVAFYQDRLTGEELLKRADDPEQRCQAHCHIGIRLEAERDRDGARAAYQASVDTKESTLTEYLWAEGRLAKK